MRYTSKYVLGSIFKQKRGLGLTLHLGMNHNYIVFPKAREKVRTYKYSFSRAHRFIKNTILVGHVSSKKWSMGLRRMKGMLSKYTSRLRSQEDRNREKLAKKSSSSSSCVVPSFLKKSRQRPLIIVTKWYIFFWWIGCFSFLQCVRVRM